MLISDRYSRDTSLSIDNALRDAFRYVSTGLR